MYARICGYVLSLVSVSLIVAGCDDSHNRSPTAPGKGLSTLVTAEPAAIAPEFLSNPFCATLPAFRAQLSLTIQPVEDLAVRVIQFEFTDRFGGRAIPTVIPTLGTAATLPNSMPVPLPTSSPVPVPTSSPIPTPGTLPFEGLGFPAGSRTLPLVLEFGCGVSAAGTLFIIVETADGRGMSGVSRLSVAIGS